MTQDPGLWEFCPSGGVEVGCYDKVRNTINYEKQIITELEQELSLSSNDISNLIPFCLIEDNESGVIDICFRANLLIPFSSIIKNHEYSELIEIPKDKLDNFYRANINLISSCSRHIIKNYLMK